MYDAGPLGANGTQPVTWTLAAAARAQASRLTAEHRGHRSEVVRNPHRTEKWAQATVSAPQLLAAVQQVVGPSVAVENTFLVIKWPGSDFEVPWHQDGINDRLELDPDRSVAAWLALTDAQPDTGCLHVVPGSQRQGYLPYGAEDDTGAARGRALGAHVPSETRGTTVLVTAGEGLLMDVRLLHRSGSNRAGAPRIGLNIRYVAPGAIRVRDGSSPSLYPLSGTGW